MMLDPNLQNHRVGVIQNAHDGWTDSLKRKSVLDREFLGMQTIGLAPEEIDLRNFFEKKAELEKTLQGYSYIWVCGGNTFILRRAFALSGFDQILLENLPGNAFVYGGYSAGVCVLAPTLKGIHLADEPEIHPEGYGNEVIWEGLGVLPFCVAPHYQSDHHESEMINQAIEYFIQNKIPFVALRDGEAILFESSLEAGPSQGVKILG